jgi:Trm5-related predicted tRNA methylase
MPMTTAEMERAIVQLQARVDRVTVVNNELAKRVEGLEKAGPSTVQLQRIADALDDVADAAHGPYGGRQ